MKFMKMALVCSCIFAVCIVSITADRSFAEKKAKQPSLEQGVVIGHLHTRDKVVTISKGQKGIAYTIKTKDGKTLDANLSEKKFQAKYPTLFDQIKDGRAGNDAILRPMKMPIVHPDRRNIPDK